MTEPDPGTEWDFEAWLDQLKARLEIAGNGYLKRSLDEDDVDFLYGYWPPIPANRTSFAWLAVGMVQQAIAELPGMRGHVGLVPLHDVVAAMIDLGGGAKPPLLQPLKGKGAVGEATKRRWVRQHALLFVDVLTQSGMTATDACKLVANTLSRAGHTNRKRGSETSGLSWKTVERWWTASRQRDFGEKDPRMAGFLDRSVSRLKEGRGWPLAVQEAQQWVQEMVASPLLSSKT